MRLPTKKTLMNTEESHKNTIKTVVRERYGRIAVSEDGCGCSPTCCAPKDGNGLKLPSASVGATRLGYSAEDLDRVPAGANLGLGCGNPLGFAALRPGETVLDLGSGAGFDAFLAARAVGPSGHVIGVDMTPEMISKARQNQAGAGFENVEFRLGEIECLPVADASVDVLLSNCVINLSPDKGRVFREAFRVLRHGGRLAIADIVALAPLPEEFRKDWELYTSCVAGASQVNELRAMLTQAGFVDIRIVHQGGGREIVSQWFPGRSADEFVSSARIEAAKP